MKRLRGSCLCGAIVYEVADDFRYMGYCHCSECRKFSGSAFAAAGGIQDSQLAILKGSERLSRYAKNDKTNLVFCSCCGSSLYSEKLDRGMLHLRLGTLDDTPTKRPSYHVFVGSKAEWDVIADDLPQYATRP